MKQLAGPRAETQRTRPPSGGRVRWSTQLQLLDVAAAILAVCAALGLSWLGAGVSAGWVAVAGGGTLLCVAAFGAYRPRMRIVSPEDAVLVAAAAALAAMGTAALESASGGSPVDIAGASVTFVLVAGSITGARLAATWADGAHSSAIQRRAVIVGAGKVGRLLARRLHETPSLRVAPVGFLDAYPLEVKGDDPGGPPVLGATEELEHVVREHDVDLVIVAFSTDSHGVLVDLLSRCEPLGVDVSVVPRLFEKMPRRIAVEHIGGLSLFTIGPAHPAGFPFLVKYALDRIIAATMLVVLAPALLAITAAVVWTSGEGAVFRQARVGRDGREFQLLKFRTMRSEVDGADNSDAARTTPFGAFLRGSSLDELPQLINVVRGEMSLIGPRPERPHLVDEFSMSIHRYSERHRVKSGITGWAQVHGIGRGTMRFSDVSLAERAEWDNYYVENWSPWLDMKIAAMTVRALLRYRQR